MNTHNITDSQYPEFINFMNTYLPLKVVKSTLKDNLGQSGNLAKAFLHFSSLSNSTLYKSFIKGGDWEEFFSYTFDPKRNKLRLMNIDNFNYNYTPVEMWTDSDCLLVDK